MVARKVEGTSDYRDLARGAAQNLAGFILRLGARLPFLLIVALLYGKAAFGAYLLAVAFVESVNALVGLGFKRSMFQFIERAKGRETGRQVHTLVVTCLMISLSVGASVIAGLYALDRLLDLRQVFTSTMFYLLPTTLLYTSAEILLASTRAARKMRYEVTAKSFVEPYSLTLFAALFYALGLPDLGLYYAYWCMVICVIVYAFWAFSKEYDVGRVFDIQVHDLDFQAARTLFRFTLPTALSDCITNIAGRVDVYILAAFVSPEALGIYGIALQILTIVKKIRQSFDPVLDPIVAQALKSSPIKVVSRKIANVGLSIFLLQMLIVGLLLYFGQFLLAMFGVAGPAAKTTLIVLVLSTVVIDSFGLPETVFIYKKPIINMAAAGLGLLAFLAIGAVLIKDFNIVGAAVSMLAANALRALFLLIMMRRTYHVTPLDPRLAFVAGVFGLHVLIMYQVTQVWPDQEGVSAAISILLGLVIYGGLFKWFARNHKNEDTSP